MRMQYYRIAIFGCYLHDIGDVIRETIANTGRFRKNGKLLSQMFSFAFCVINDRQYYKTVFNSLVTNLVNIL